MRPYADDVRTVLGETLTPELQTALHTIYLSIYAPARQQMVRSQHPDGAPPISASTRSTTTAAPQIQDRETAAPESSVSGDALSDVGITV
jgi:hypothetical protein